MGPGGGGGGGSGGMLTRMHATTSLLVGVGCAEPHLTTHSELLGTQTAAMHTWAEYCTHASQHCCWLWGPRTTAPSGPAKSRYLLKLQLLAAAVAASNVRTVHIIIAIVKRSVELYPAGSACRPAPPRAGGPSRYNDLGTARAF